MREQLPVEFASIEVKDVDGAVHRIGEAWAGRTAVLLFVRHFG